MALEFAALMAQVSSFLGLIVRFALNFTDSFISCFEQNQRYVF